MSKMNKFQAFRERNRKSNGYLLRKVSFNVAYKIVRFVLLFGLCFLILQPLLNKISISFMEERDLYDSTINVIPRHFTLDNFKIAADLMDYWAALGNTLWISLLVSILQIISCTLVGYGFARYEFKGKKILMGILIFSYILPRQITMIPTYVLYTKMGIQGTLWAFILPALFGNGLNSPIFILIFYQFFKQIPKVLSLIHI